MDLPNKSRNDEVSTAIKELKEADAGAQAEKKAGIAISLSNLDLAESIQLLHLQIVSISKEIRATIKMSTDQMIESNKQLSASNDRHAVAMKWLTAGLIFVGLLQVIVTWKSSH